MNYYKLINFLKYYTTSDNNTEIGEQESAGSTTSPPYPTVTKWETGIARGLANQIDDKVTWSSLYKITRGKANTLL